MSERLIELHKEMKPLCMEARISEYQYDRMLDFPNLLQEIEEFYKGPYSSALKIKGLLPDHIWKKYKMFGISKLQEQKLLNKCFKEMRNSFKRIIPNENEIQTEVK